MNKYFYRILFAGAITFVIIIVTFVGLEAKITAESLTESGGFLFDLVQKNYALSIIVFILIVALFTAIFTPGIIFLTITGGFLFGIYHGALAANIGMTLGSAVAFLSAKYLLHDLIRRIFKKRLNAFDSHIKSEGVHYLLFLRLSPVIPAFLINLFSGLTKIRFRTFVWTTSVGTLPSDIIYAYVGNEMKENNLLVIFTPGILLALTILAFISIIPIWLRRRRIGKNK